MPPLESPPARAPILGSPEPGALRRAVRAALLGDPLEPVPQAARSEVTAALTKLGLAGLVVSAADSGGWALGGALGAEGAERLRAWAQRVGFETTLRLETGRRAKGLLEEAGIPVLLYKGAALLETRVYDDVRARPMTDVDLLVPPPRAADAVEALESGGFRSWEPWTEAHLGWVSAFALEDGEAPAGVSSTVDLHWATDYGRLRHASDWAGETLWEDRTGALPAPEAHFVVTVEHFLKHLRVTVHLLALADLVRLLPTLTRPTAVARHARARGTLPGVRAVVGALEALGAEAPEGLSEALGGRGQVAKAGGRARLELEALLARADGSEPRLRDWTTLRGPRGTLREAVRVLAPSAGWLRARYPDASGGGARRLRYLADCLRWVVAGGASPLSPNQDLL